MGIAGRVVLALLATIAVAEAVCSNTSFTCDNGDCIDASLKCNGYNNCGDNSDESGKICPSASSWVGYFGAAIAAIFFGSNFVPVKKYETGDGLFFQWVMCSGIWTVGLIVNFIQGQVPFQPMAALGGVFWATGNLTVVPAVKSIGLAQGLLVWGTINMILGWAAARFGWFGLNSEVPANPTLQYFGVLCAVVSVFLYALVKTEVKAPTTSESDPLLRPMNEGADYEEDNKGSWVERLSASKRRIVGLGLSCLGGVCYSVTFDPSQYVMDTQRGASQDALDYAYSQYSGIFLASTFYFMLYSVASNNKPSVYPQVIVPGFISGIMWGIAQSAWFVANQKLSQAVSYPIVTTLPGIIGTLWGAVVFGEIRGMRNYLILGMAYAITFAGVTLTVLSK